MGSDAISSAIHWLFQASLSTSARVAGRDALDARQPAAVLQHQARAPRCRAPTAGCGPRRRRAPDCRVRRRPRPWSGTAAASSRCCENLLMSRMSMASGGDSCAAISRALGRHRALAHLAGPGAALPLPQRAEHRGEVVSVLERAEVDGAFAAGERIRPRAAGCSSGR